MGEKATEYINNQIFQSPQLLMSYAGDKDGNEYIKREAFYTILGKLEKFISGERGTRIIAIPGLRGVGKTTLLAQLFLYVSTKYPKDVLYLSVDQIVNVLGSSLNEVLDDYQKVLGERFSHLTSPKFLFIDEIHFDPKWVWILKMLYDTTKDIFVVCTGSSALSLQNTADLARRVYFEKLAPLSFSQYQQLKNNASFVLPRLSADLKEALFFSKDATEAFKKVQALHSKMNQCWFGVDRMEIAKYLKYGSMPYAVKMDNDMESNVYTLQIIDKLVEKDLPAYKNFDADTIRSVKNIILLVASSLEVSVSKIAESLAGISVNTITDVFDALEKAELFIRVFPYGSSYKKVRKPSKFYFSSPAIRHAMLSIVEGENAFARNKGSYLEDASALVLNRCFNTALNLPLFYHNAKGGADFIIDFVSRKIVVEIGYGGKSEKQVNFTLKEVKGAYGMVVCDGDLGLAGNVIKLPLEYFFLL